MPELPDITIYVEALNRFIAGHHMTSIQIRSPFVLRTFDPDIALCTDKTVLEVRRIGKRLIWELEDQLFIVIHLMIAGRLHWKKTGTKASRKVDLAAFAFEHGTMLLTEASPKKRASIHVHRGAESLVEHERGGLDTLACSLQEFSEQLRSQNRTLKRALTDPTMFDGIGNAYSDEILHAARLSPLKLTSQLSGDEISGLFVATTETLDTWTERLRCLVGEGFPNKVTAFHPEMAVHGRFREPCPECGAKVQRIVSAEREFNYCPECQTNGRILRDRSLSRLLNDDWPGNIDE